ncbi:MAG TPA: cytochrome P450 [Tepidisphaeraceae bacterium]|nr:cytochrome P450 [Tepidisphaeraceae bacterium]
MFQSHGDITLESMASGKIFRGPRGHWLRGCLREMQRDPLRLYSETRRDFGDYVRMRVVRGIDCYILTHPDAVEHVLHKGHKNYRKPDIFSKAVGLLVGDGLFTNEGDSWLSQRKLAQPAFHGHSIAQLCPLIVEATQAFVRDHETRAPEPMDMSAAMMKLGLRITSTTLFSADISGDADAIGRAFRIAFAHISDRLNSMQIVPSWFPTHANRTFVRAKKNLDDVVAELIDSHHGNPDKPHDLLTMLLGARDAETGKGMPERLLMDEVLTLLTAGHENIGAALTWTWYLLALHQEVQANVYDELHGRLRGASLTIDDVSHLPLLRAVFEEAMRIYPPGWGELRETIGADQVQGYDIPAKAMIILCQWVTHRHPDFWEAPEQFKPERFLPAQARDRHRFSYFPFGGGPRICIGMQLAMIEGSLVLATILQRFNVELVGDQVVVPDATFTLRPKYGLKVILKPRASAAP